MAYANIGFPPYKHHSTRDCKCVLGDEARLVPFVKNSANGRSSVLSQAVAICMVLQITDAVIPLGRSTPQAPPSMPPNLRLHAPEHYFAQGPGQQSCGNSLRINAEFPLFASLLARRPCIRTLLEAIFSAIENGPASELGIPLSLSQISFDVLRWTQDMSNFPAVCLGPSFDLSIHLSGNSTIVDGQDCHHVKEHYVCKLPDRDSALLGFLPGHSRICFVHFSMITVTARVISRVHKRTLGHSHMTKPFTNYWLRVFRYCSV